MAEMRLSSVIMVLVVLAGVGVVVAGFTGYLAIGWFNKDNLNKMVDQGMGAAAGFTPAKTPQEAMDKFREAIERREYTYAAKYCTKDYAAMLDRSAVGAKDLGTAIDRIRDYAKNKGTETDKVRFLFLLLDPFPKILKSGPAPVQKGDKYYGTYVFEIPSATTSPDKLLQELGNVDRRMYQSVLAPKLVFGNPIEIVKEGEDWKLNIATNPVWQQEVAYFADNWKTYYTGLDAFKGWMINNNAQIATPQGMEQEILETLRKLKKPA